MRGRPVAGTATAFFDLAPAGDGSVAAVAPVDAATADFSDIGPIAQLVVSSTHAKIQNRIYSPSLSSCASGSVTSTSSSLGLLSEEARGRSSADAVTSCNVSSSKPNSYNPKRTNEHITTIIPHTHVTQHTHIPRRYQRCHPAADHHRLLAQAETSLHHHVSSAAQQLDSLTSM